MRLPVITLSSTLLLTLIALPAHARNGCRLFVGIDNRDRFVTGPINSECGILHPGPWGNWGVEGPFSSRQDGDQFAGWYDEDGHQQWNSCYDEYPSGSDGYFNWGDDEAQITDVGDQWYTYGLGGYLINISCAVFNNYVVTVEAHEIDVYELDPASPDDYLASIIYDEQSFTLSCSGSGTSATCYGETTFQEPLAAPSEFTALGRAWGHANWGPI
ncbi:MAG: hypothetical protein IT184_16400 [Acidobacteria bacterium]|nr:hypothetical protein [Acidobacteriota bacterium]